MNSKIFIKIISILAICYPTLVFAKVGMPQLNTESFYSQIFWLAVSFSLLYWIMVKAILPKISLTLQSRRDAILSDLDSSEELKKKSQEISKNYEILLSESNEKKSQIIKKATLAADNSFKEKIAAIEDKCNIKIKEAESRISEAKFKARTAIKSTAQLISNDIIKKVVKLEISNKNQDLFVEELIQKKWKDEL